MKKMVFTLALLLMSLSAAMAQTWTFGAMSEADKALCAADANWVKGTDRYGYTLALENEALVANGSELAYTKGLKFTAGAPTTKDEGKAKVRLNYGSSRLELNGNGVSLIIPSLKAGQKVTVSCCTGKTDVARGLNATNITPVSGSFNATSADKVTNVGTVTADGDVVLTTNVGGMYIYSIKVETVGGGSTDTPGSTDKITHAVARNSKVNQMYVTTKSGDVKYYNTADLTSVKFEGDKTIIAPKSGAESDEYNASVQAISFAKKADQGESGDIDNPAGVIQITEAKGWQESAYLKWAPFEGASSYNVYVDGKKIDAQLIRQYASYYRADVLGLKAGTYSVKVVPVNAEGTEIAGANTASNLVVKSYNREGFAHKGISDGVGAYNNDGTLKAGAKVLYVTKNTFTTIKASLNGEEYTGIGNILLAKQKGKDETPLAVRVIGEIKTANAGDQLKTDQKGLLLKGNSATTVMNVTIEGIGDDACFNGFGLGIINGTNVEVRNMAFFNQGSSNDNMEIKGTQHIWVHNNDYFYGEKGSGDHGKGDGSLDSKDGASFCTFSYNHYHDTGKSNLCGMKKETVDNLICYHHNWFDHSDSRHPRVRTSSVHIWNNYYDGVAKYGVGVTMGASVFVESNYFRNTKYPMMISKQGTDAKGDGTFSGENGGVLKAYGNIFAEKSKYFSYITWKNSNTDFDAYEVDSPSETVPSSVVAKAGGTSYNNFDTDASKMYAYTPDAAVDVPAKVTGFYGAGRLNQGDIHYTFNNATDDADYGRCAGLDNVLSSYKTGLVNIFGDESASSGETGSGSTGEGGETGGSGEGGSTVTPIEGTVICSFAGGQVSNSSFTVAGNFKNSTTGVSVDGNTYKDYLKLESSAGTVSFKTTAKMQMTCYTGDTKAKLKIDGADVTGDTTKGVVTVTLEAGDHSIAKAGSGSQSLYLIKLVPVTE